MSQRAATGKGTICRVQPYGSADIRITIAPRLDERLERVDVVNLKERLLDRRQRADVQVPVNAVIDSPNKVAAAHRVADHRQAAGSCDGPTVRRGVVTALASTSCINSSPLTPSAVASFTQSD